MAAACLSTQTAYSIMYGGTISENRAGSGVQVGSSQSDGYFFMYGGTISGNRVSYFGGGVYVIGGTFTKTGSTVYGIPA